MAKPKSRLSSWLDRLVFNGPAPAACRPLPDCLLTPVLFANGRDIDDAGLKAFLENRPVMFAGEMIAPGPHTLQGYPFRVAATMIEIRREGQVIEVLGFPQYLHMVNRRDRILTIDVSGQPQGLRRTLDCKMMFNAPVLP